MTKLYSIQGVITDLRRLNNSSNGNPRFMIVIDGVVLTTKSDCYYSYNIENLYREGCIVVADCYDTKHHSKIERIKKSIK